MIYRDPYLVKLPQTGKMELGFLSILEIERNLPFQVKRIFWLTDVIFDMQRGHHAHKKTEQFLICLSGEIIFKAIMPDYREFNFTLNKPNEGVYIPPHAWHEMQYKKDTIQLVMASEIYNELDYLRSKDKFLSYYITEK